MNNLDWLTVHIMETTFSAGGSTRHMHPVTYASMQYVIANRRMIRQMALTTRSIEERTARMKKGMQTERDAMEIIWGMPNH